MRASTNPASHAEVKFLYNSSISVEVNTHGVSSFIGSSIQNCSNNGKTALLCFSSESSIFQKIFWLYLS
ncbi:hypothetical protein HOB94_00020 [bacterium]|nr:hypothetical protein [bacterium]